MQGKGPFGKSGKCVQLNATIYVALYWSKETLWGSHFVKEIEIEMLKEGHVKGQKQITKITTIHKYTLVEPN